MDTNWKTRLVDFAHGSGDIVVLTGAGISAESGIPTFRGPDGFWTVGSENYHPQEMATQASFQRMPTEVWRWYLYRRSVCRAAHPNPAHEALTALERALGDRFLLVTQNVDGLHIRAGNSLARTYEIHGNIDFMRCPSEQRVLPVPSEVHQNWTRETPFDEETRALLHCCDENALARPHVLWFDECYDEGLYRFESSLRAANECALLLVIGTSGQTNLPVQMVHSAVRRGIPFLVVNRDPSPFTQLAKDSPNGMVLFGDAGEQVPRLVDAMTHALGAKS